jgi:hypothetical protein
MWTLQGTGRVFCSRAESGHSGILAAQIEIRVLAAKKQVETLTQATGLKPRSREVDRLVSELVAMGQGRPKKAVGR